MIKLSTYARLLVEAKMTSEMFANKLTAAFKSILDIDEVTVTKHKFSQHGPSFTHSWYNVSHIVQYKGEKFKIVTHCYHLKFPETELQGLSSIEWDEMLKHAERFPNIETTDDLLAKPNIQIRLTASASYYFDELDNFISEPQEFSERYLGMVKANNIRDLVMHIKDLLDKPPGDDDGGDAKEPDPVVPVGVGVN